MTELKNLTNEQTFIRQILEKLEEEKPILGTCTHFVRPSKHQYSFFDNRESAKQFLVDCFLASDETISEFKWYQEYEQVLDYLCNTLGQGLSLIGNSGVGKSRIIYSAIPTLLYTHRKLLKPVKSYELNFDNFRTYLNKTTFIAIDEIGREPIASKYGEKTEMIEIILDECEYKGKPFFCTSNSNLDQLEDRYGKPTIDRWFRVSKIISFSGETSR